MARRCCCASGWRSCWASMRRPWRSWRAQAQHLSPPSTPRRWKKASVYCWCGCCGSQGLAFMLLHCASQGCWQPADERSQKQSRSMLQPNLVCTPVAYPCFALHALKYCCWKQYHSTFVACLQAAAGRGFREQLAARAERLARHPPPPPSDLAPPPQVPRRTCVTRQDIAKGAGLRCRVN